MTYALIEDNSIVAISEAGALKRLMARMDPPRLVGRDIIDLPEGWVKIEDAQPPSATDTQKVTAGEPEEYQPGKWRRTWIVSDLTPEELAERLASKRAGMIVSMRQARLVLLGAGLLANVDAAIASIPDAGAKAAAEIDWEYATEVRRVSPLIASLAPALGLTDEQIDALFEAAAAIP